MPQDGQQSTKQPYTSPTLVTYGDVLRITEASKTGIKSFTDSKFTFRTG